MTYSTALPYPISLPSGYQIELPDTQERISALWLDVEDVFLNEGIEIGDPDSERLIAVLHSPDKEIVGAVYGSTSEQIYSFHIAIAQEHQGLGFSHALVNLGIADFQREISENEPQAELELYVIHPYLKDVLYRRGFHVSATFRGEDGSDAYYMNPVENIKPFFDVANHNNPTSLRESLIAAADSAKVSFGAFYKIFQTWCESPIHEMWSPFGVAILTKMTDSWDIPIHDKEFLRVQSFMSSQMKSSKRWRDYSSDLTVLHEHQNAELNVKKNEPEPGISKSDSTPNSISRTYRM